MLRGGLPSARTVATALCGVGSTLVVVGVVLVAADGPRPSRVIDPVMRAWARCWLAPTGARVEVVGSRSLRPGQPYVIVSNHQSNLDPIVHLATLEISLRFLAMRELFDLPLVGAALRRLGMIEVDRGDPAGARIAVGVRRALSTGASVLVYPEGGTSGDGSVGPFRSGAFRLAIDNGVCVVPIATVGTRRVWPTDRHVIGPGRVLVVIGDPITTSGLLPADAAALRDRAHTWITTTVAATSHRRDDLNG